MDHGGRHFEHCIAEQIISNLQQEHYKKMKKNRDQKEGVDAVKWNRQAWKMGVWILSTKTDTEKEVAIAIGAGEENV